MVVVKLLARSDCVTISSGPFVVFIELAVCMICELILLADTVGVKRELSIMSFLNQSKQLMHTFIHNNWQIKRSFYAKVSERSFSYMTTLGHLLQKQPGKR